MFLCFLDFDGCLHPQHNREPTPADLIFCHLPRFEGVMRDFPSVEIVISSMWRYQFTLDELRGRFSPDIAARIIDTTAKSERADGYSPNRREGEILHWLLATGNKDTPWIAIDDAVWQFEKHRDRLVGCTGYRGIDDEVEERLRTLLKRCLQDDRAQ